MKHRRGILVARWLENVFGPFWNTRVASQSYRTIFWFYRLSRVGPRHIFSRTFYLRLLGFDSYITFRGWCVALRVFHAKIWLTIYRRRLVTRKAFLVSDIRLWSNNMRRQAILDRQNFTLTHNFSYLFCLFFGMPIFFWLELFFPGFFLSY